MKKSTLPAWRNPVIYLWLILSLFLAYEATYFLFEAAFPYYSFEEETFGRFLRVKWWLIGHVSGGILALLIGPFQFWKYIRTRHIKVHRTLGKIYILAIVMASCCSFYMAFTTALAIHWTWSIALFSLGLVWIVSVLMAYRFIRLKRVQLHKEWMIRSYVITFGFVTFRFLEDLPLIQNSGKFVEHGPTVAWLAWAIPLFFSEVILNWNRQK